MTKPWEEDWQASGNKVVEHPLADRVVATTTSVSRFGGASSTPEERARLIAAAPDLVRALLALEWSAEMGGHFGVCPSCEACGKRHCLAEHEPEPHTPDCVVDAALRKAGVR